ncbi:hypothetical protein NX059_007814 [Plenodomus lindquistii]|nr:hypothetical protein NX059_007814 [Plenodomus lindquistii]
MLSVDHPGLIRRSFTANSSTPEDRLGHPNRERSNAISSGSQSDAPTSPPQRNPAMSAARQYTPRNVPTANTPLANENQLDRPGAASTTNFTARNTSIPGPRQTSTYTPPGTLTRYTTWAQETFGTAPVGSQRSSRNRRGLGHTRSFPGAIPRTRGNSPSLEGGFHRNVDEELQIVLRRRRNLVRQWEEREDFAAASRRAAEAGVRVIEERTASTR